MAQLQVELEAAAADLEAVEAALEAAGAMAQTYQAEDGSVLLEPGVGEHPLWSRVRVTALFPGEADAEQLIRHLAEQLGERAGAWRSERLEEQAWERAWLEHFRPMAFGERLWVLPHEAEASLPEGAVAIRLDPGLAFGTGTHETTALCLEWLDGEPLAGARGIDYGAGSGVLAVAAALLGARECLAIDNDPQAVTASRENAANNGVADRVPACLPEQRPQAYCADFLVANILAGTLAEQAAELLAGLAPKGRLALSGILEGQQQRVMDAFGPQIAWDAPRRRGEWLLLSGTRL
ncbi:50S ribosomal protein L11 methyltransferase [Halorhodospira neutriphila]|uniref:Ribosomal protein L11 methyltransferase n=1 Tax=Halorhodospira neutriphila TaxID=168379 RepID=A0ABS1ECP1_9GAMM|nr:50S ribosomal protein L11 methyltransferase [Halorhodospira neutriphila]